MGKVAGKCIEFCSLDHDYWLFFFPLAQIEVHTMLLPVERHVKSGIYLYSFRDGDVQRRRGNFSEKSGRCHYFSQPQTLHYQSFSLVISSAALCFLLALKSKEWSCECKMESKQKLQACAGIHREN